MFDSLKLHPACNVQRWQFTVVVVVVVVVVVWGREGGSRKGEGKKG